jgi:hypothetical protein
MENGPPKPDINWSRLVADSRGEQELGESISSATGELTDSDTRPDHPCMDLDKNQLKQMDLSQLHRTVSDLKKLTDSMSLDLVTILNRRDRLSDRLVQKFDILTSMLKSLSVNISG